MSIALTLVCDIYFTHSQTTEVVCKYKVECHIFADMFNTCTAQCWSMLKITHYIISDCISMLLQSLHRLNTISEATGYDTGFSDDCVMCSPSALSLTTSMISQQH